MKRLRHIISESAVLLLEYDRDKTIHQHGEKALNVALNRRESDSYLSDIHGLAQGVVRGHNDLHDKEPRDKAMHELMGQFEDVDPTSQKKYVQHIARIYGNGGVPRHEDIYARMKPALRDFHDLASRKVIPADKRDIGRVKSLSELEDIVDAHKEKTSSRQNDKAYHDKMKTQADITEHPDFTHIIPKTAAAAAHFGKGTKWCTATDNPEDSMFDYYNADGPLQIMIPKKPKYKGEKYQYHHASEQFMDEQDEPVDDNQTPHNSINKFVSNYAKKVKDTALDNPTPDHPESRVRQYYWTNKAHPDEALDHILSSKSSLDEKDSILAYRDDWKPKHLKELVGSDDNAISYMAAGHRKADAEVLDHAMNSKHWDTRYAAMNHINHTEKHVDKAVLDPSSEVVGAAADSEHLKPHHIDAILNNKAYPAMNGLSKAAKDDDRFGPLRRLGYNPLVKGKHLETLLNHENEYVRRAAISNYNLKPDQLMKALGDESESVRIGARKRYLRDNPNKGDRKFLNSVIDSAIGPGSGPGQQDFLNPSRYHYMDKDSFSDIKWNRMFNGEPPEEKNAKGKRLQDIIWHGNK